MAEKLDELNRCPFKKRVGSRLLVFEEEEKAFLQPLPARIFDPSVWLHPKVGVDYLVTDGKNKYSVPFDLIGKTSGCMPYPKCGRGLPQAGQSSLPCAAGKGPA